MSLNDIDKIILFMILIEKIKLFSLELCNKALTGDEILRVVRVVLELPLLKEDKAFGKYRLITIWLPNYCIQKNLAF